MTGVNLQHLVSLSKNLNEASDALSKEILAVEEALNRLKLGVRAWVVLGRYSEDHGAASAVPYVTRVESLGYSKHKGKWTLLYSVDYDEIPEMGYACPLRDAPREDRIEAVAKLPELISTLEKQVQAVAEQAAARTQEAKALASAIQHAVE